MNQDDKQAANQPVTQVTTVSAPPKSGPRAAWTILGFVGLMVICLIIGGLVDLFAPQFSTALGYILVIGIGLAALIGVAVMMIRATKGAKDKK